MEEPPPLPTLPAEEPKNWDTPAAAPQGSTHHLFSGRVPSEHRSPDSPDLGSRSTQKVKAEGLAVARLYIQPWRSKQVLREDLAGRNLGSPTLQAHRHPVVPH